MSAVLNNPLWKIHEDDEAAFLPWGRDVQIVESYGEVELEYAAIRKGAALMDVPQRAVVILTGKDRRSFLQNKVTNDVSRLAPGKGVYAYLLNLKGRIVMDLNILETEEGTLAEVDRRLAGDFVRDMQKYIFMEDVRVAMGRSNWGRLSRAGTEGGGGSGKGDGAALPEGPLEHVRGVIGGAEVRAVRNDLAGEAQWELIVPRERLVDVWQALLGVVGEGGELKVRPVGWSAFRLARIEAGTPIYGIDITDNYLPMETAQWYGRAVSVTKGCYVGQEVVARMHCASGGGADAGGAAGGGRESAGGGDGDFGGGRWGGGRDGDEQLRVADAGGGGGGDGGYKEGVCGCREGGGGVGGGGVCEGEGGGDAGVEALNH